MKGKLQAGTWCLLTGGLACYWSFFRRYEFSVFFLGYEGAGWYLTISYGIVMVLMMIVASVVIVCRQWALRALSIYRMQVMLLCLLGSIGYVCLAAAPHVPLPTWFVCGVGLVLIAVSYVSLTFAWTVSIVEIGGSKALACAALSFPLSSLLSLCAYTSLPMVLTVTTLLPALSGICWFFLKTKPMLAIDHARSALRRLPWNQIAIFGAFIIVGRLIVGILYLDGTTVVLSERIETIVLSSVVLCLVAAMLLRSRQWESMLRRCWVIIAIIYFMGVMLVIPFNSAFSYLGTGTITAELNCFEILLWIILVAVVSQERISPILVFGLYFIFLKALPTLAGRVVVPWLVDSFGWSTQEYSVVLVIVMALMLMGSVFVFLNAQAIKNASQASGQIPNQVPRNDICAQIAAEASLSPREVEVLSYVSKGYSTKRIAEMLVVSQGTVQTHVKNMYRKIGVHTKQELIDIVDTACEKAGVM